MHVPSYALLMMMEYDLFITNQDCAVLNLFPINNRMSVAMSACEMWNAS